MDEWKTYDNLIPNGHDLTIQKTNFSAAGTI